MKYPALMLFTGDWLKDPALTICSPSTRGVWADLLCAMHELDQCGVITGSADQLARISRCDRNQLLDALEELQATKAADISPDIGALRVTEEFAKITVGNRRMIREYRSRVNNALRQQRFRAKGKSNAHITPIDMNMGTVPNKNEVGTEEIPTVEQAVAQTMTCGIPEDFTRYVYSMWSRRGGADCNGNSVVWLRYVQSRWVSEGQQWNNGSHFGKRNGNQQKIPLSILIDGLRKECERHPGNTASAYSQNPTELERADYRAKKAKLRELEKELAACAMNHKQT